MADMMTVDIWMHNVLNYKMKKEEYEKKFQEFSPYQNAFIYKEIRDNIIPDLKKRNFEESVIAYEEILKNLEQYADKEEIKNNQ